MTLEIKTITTPFVFNVSVNCYLVRTGDGYKPRPIASGEFMNKQVEAFWQAYLASLPAGAEPPSSYEAWSFCDNEEAANELGDLAKAGRKTATCSLVWAYEAEHEELPKVGDISIITNWDGDPLCIIETVEVQVRAFNEVDIKFAYDEGEGDRSLAYWRQVHWDVFSKECLAMGREPTETMPLVCERFRVVFPQ